MVGGVNFEWGGTNLHFARFVDRSARKTDCVGPYYLLFQWRPRAPCMVVAMGSCPYVPPLSLVLEFIFLKLMYILVYTCQFNFRYPPDAKKTKWKWKPVYLMSLQTDLSSENRVVLKQNARSNVSSPIFRISVIRNKLFSGIRFSTMLTDVFTLTIVMLYRSWNETYQLLRYDPV